MASEANPNRSESGLNEEGMAKAMHDEEDRFGEAAAGRPSEEFMKEDNNKVGQWIISPSMKKQ